MSIYKSREFDCFAWALHEAERDAKEAFNQIKKNGKEDDWLKSCCLGGTQGFDFCEKKVNHLVVSTGGIAQQLRLSQSPEDAAARIDASLTRIEQQEFQNTDFPADILSIKNTARHFVLAFAVSLEELNSDFASALKTAHPVIAKDIEEWRNQYACAKRLSLGNASKHLAPFKHGLGS